MDLLEGIATTRAIRRYTDEPVTNAQLNQILFAATRAPSGSNRQRFRFLVLRDEPVARDARALLAKGAQAVWGNKRTTDKYDRNAEADSPKARMAATMTHYVEQLGDAPVIVLPCLIRHRAPTPTEGGSVYPAVQNLLLAARAIGLGGVLTGFQAAVEDELRSLLDIPADVLMAGTITLGHPAGNHGPVRRRPLQEFVFETSWGNHPAWPEDPPGTRFTSAGPPKS